MGKLAVLIGAVTLAAGLGATSNSPRTGTETLTGVATGFATKSLDTNIPVRVVFSGLVDTSDSMLGGNQICTHPAPGETSCESQTVTASSLAGKLVLTNNVKSVQLHGPRWTRSGNTCYVKYRLTATYTVDGSKSTGKFAGATGHGTYTFGIVTASTLPKRATCTSSETNNTGKPIAKDTSIAVKASGPLTLKS